MIYVGIDVASDKHNVCIIDTKETVLSEFAIANSRSGFELLLAAINSFDKVSIGLEATGIYGDNLVSFLHAHSFNTITINPLSAKRLLNAKSLRKTKTDKMDAFGIAGLLIQEFQNPDTPVSYHISELKSLTRLRYQLVTDRSKQKVRAKRLITLLFPEFKGFFFNTFCATAIAVLSRYPSASDLSKCRINTLTDILYSASRGRYGQEKAEQMKAVAKSSIGTYSKANIIALKSCLNLIDFYNQQIKEVEKEIKTLIDETDTPITSVPGISTTLGAVILSEIGDINRFSNANKLLAFAGLDPSVYQSGKFKPTTGSMVKHGSPYLRNAIVQAAKQVSRFNDTFAAFLAKKISEGKHYNVAISHVAKKLIRVIFHLLVNNQSFSNLLLT